MSANGRICALVHVTSLMSHNLKWFKPRCVGHRLLVWESQRVWDYRLKQSLELISNWYAWSRALGLLPSGATLRLATLTEGIPAFCLACMGTNNKFTAHYVLKWWKHIFSEAKKRGITVVSFGDTITLTFLQPAKAFHPVRMVFLVCSKKPNCHSLCTRHSAHSCEAQIIILPLGRVSCWYPPPSSCTVYIWQGPAWSAGEGHKP